MRLYQILLLTVCYFAFASVAYSAPDPAELAKQKKLAPLIIEGIVKDDTLLENQESDHTQTRMMDIEIIQIDQQNLSVPINKKQSLQVQYQYLPYWENYSGGISIQIVKGDRIRLWLHKDRNTFTPILGGHGVEIIQANGKRIEHVQEPFFHKVGRIWNDSWREQSSLIVFLLIFLSLLVILLTGYRYMR